MSRSNGNIFRGDGIRGDAVLSSISPDAGRLGWIGRQGDKKGLRIMKSKVYFVPVKDAGDVGSVNEKLGALIEESGVLDCVDEGNRVGVKLHFGEEGNTGYVRPEHVRVVCEGVTARRARAFVSDTNTLYRGKRLNSADHLALAGEHGFTNDSLGAEIVIPDDKRKEETAEIHIDGKFIKKARVARVFVDAGAIVAVSHFKGHILTGFGGAIKNMGMGCAMREGKLAQHCDVAPVVHLKNCVGCGECTVACPVHAIHIENKKAVLDVKKCIGCASCMEACPNMGVFIDFEAGDKVQRKMAEYAYAVLEGKKGRAGFINFALRISQECDCWGSENPRIAPDVGILASNDPVAVDMASYDLVNEACGKDIFREVHPAPDGLKQLEYARDLGMGGMDYELVRIET